MIVIAKKIIISHKVEVPLGSTLKLVSSIEFYIINSSKFCLRSKYKMKILEAFLVFNKFL